ncbi:MAG: hypothetical protein QM809_11810 [Gordonia sp. (in: high G+C Gram-positive bacteria)]|uniref:hypothetical protein n=1 Tax=Gordonia sp. (in: high G+C Gram-positive bacteria) TaxID=84139 RepID=UPI0039E3BB8F
MRAPRFSRAAAAVLPLSLATALALTGCSGDEAPAADPNRGCDETSSRKNDGVRPIELPPAHLTVTDPGAGDRRVPVSAPRTDAPQRVTLTTESRETSVVSGREPTSTVEAVTLPLTARAGCRDPKNLEFTVTGAPTSPDEALQPALAVFDGAHGGVTFTGGLAPNELRIMPPADATDPATRAVEQSLVTAFTLAVPIPTTPVGVGARWTVTRTVSSATTLTQTLNATLKSWKDDRLVVDVAVDETPVDPVFRIPGSDATLDLTRYSNSGTGTVTVDLKTLLPAAGELKSKGARELIGSDANRPILQHTTLDLTWTTTGS